MTDLTSPLPERDGPSSSPPPERGGLGRARHLGEPPRGEPPPTPTDLLKLLIWLSPTFPTGAFAYSHALEWAVESQDVTSEQTLRPWIEDTLTHGAAHTDTILLRHAHRATTLETLAQIADLAQAATPSLERRTETLNQGNAFQIAAKVWGAPLLDALLPPVAYPVAIGALARAHHVGEHQTTLAFLHAFTTNLIGAALRLIPLGQTAGLRLIAALEPTLHHIAATTQNATLDDIGGACFRSDIAAMRHETQYTRLFRT